MPRLLKFSAVVLVTSAALVAAQETVPPAQRVDEAARRDRGAAGASEPANAEAPLERHPRVLLITAPDCATCRQELVRLRKPRGDFDAMRSRGWKIGPGAENHLQIVDREQVPALVERLQVIEFPAVVCVDGDEIVRSFKDGCGTPLDAWTFGFLLNGVNERPKAPVPDKIRVASTGSYPLRGNHWSVDGDWNPAHGTVVAHLRGPNHVAQVAAYGRIEDWSYEELRSLHDDLHERELAAGGGSYSMRSSPARESTSGFGAGRKMLGR